MTLAATDTAQQHVTENGVAALAQTEQLNHL
jgi:hypothetical protein